MVKNPAVSFNPLNSERSSMPDNAGITVKQFSTLIEISTELNSSLDTREVSARAKDAITRLMSCEDGVLLSIDSDKDELSLAASREELGDVRLKKDGGIAAGWVAHHNLPLLIPDVSKDPRHSALSDNENGDKIRDTLCVPIRLKQKVVGVLQAINKLGSTPFSEVDLELLTMFAHQVAIAIENSYFYERLHASFLEVSEALAQSIEKRDPYTGGHTKRVLAYSTSIAKYLNLSADEKEQLKIAAILHDIGKIGVRDSILQKNGKLTDEEYEEIQEHPRVGTEIIGHISHLKDVVEGMRCHHERPDGKGYPDGLRGIDIPLIARIISVADTYDAMTTDRPYQKALDEDEALAELKRWSGLQFDSAIVDAFLEAYANGDIISIKSSTHASHDLRAGGVLDKKR